MRNMVEGRSPFVPTDDRRLPDCEPTLLRQGRRLRGRAIKAISDRARSLRLAAQDVALSRRKQGFESPRERQSGFVHFDSFVLFAESPKPGCSVWAILFALRPSSFIIASVASRD